MKTNNQLLILAITVLIVFGITITSCEKMDVNPKTIEPVSTESVERKGNNNGNGGGNSGGGTTTSGTTTTTNTTTNTTTYWPLVWEGNIEFNVTVDTTICGFVIFRWANQPNFSTVRDTQYTLLGNYYLHANPLTYTFPYPCGGMYTNTNSYYYTLNAGCSFTGNHTYELYITYYWKDVANQQIVGYSSKPVIVRTGRNQWECGN